MRKRGWGEGRVTTGAVTFVVKPGMGRHVCSSFVDVWNLATVMFICMQCSIE